MNQQQANDLLNRIEGLTRLVSHLVDDAPRAWSLGWIAENYYCGMDGRTLQELAKDAGIELAKPWRNTMINRGQRAALDARFEAYQRLQARKLSPVVGGTSAR